MSITRAASRGSSPRATKPGILLPSLATVALAAACAASPAQQFTDPATTTESTTGPLPLTAAAITTCEVDRFDLRYEGTVTNTTPRVAHLYVDVEAILTDGSRAAIDKSGANSVRPGQRAQFSGRLPGPFPPGTTSGVYAVSFAVPS